LNAADGIGKAVCFAAIAVERTSFHFDQPYDYSIAPGMQIAVGSRVKVPFGTGKPRLGVVLELHNREPSAQTKPIAQLLDQSPLLPEDLVSLIPWLKERCFCTLYEAYCAMIPAGLRHSMHVLYSALPAGEAPPDSLLDADELRLVQALRNARKAFSRREGLLKKCGLPTESSLPERLAERGYLLRHTDALQNQPERIAQVYRLTGPEQGQLAPRQAEAVDFLRENGAASMKELCGYLGVSPAVVQALEKKNAIYKCDEPVGVAFLPPAQNFTPAGGENAPPTAPIELTPAQQLAFDRLHKPQKPVALLFGITGSGKTSVYLKLIDEALAQGKSAMVLVPEISLTPQMLGIFTRRYGSKVALYHSARSVGERTQAWHKLRSGEAKVVLGTRSAAFAPLQHIGLIVMDEEHEHTYKSEQSPRYHARDVAKYRAKQHGALLLLSSATPSVESYANALSGRYQLETLPERFG